MQLPEEQFKRLDRMRLERHYLLNLNVDSTDEQTVATLSVSGSTGNIYTIIVNSEGIECNCPDFDGFADLKGVYCKHCCFVIYRVLKSRLFQDNVDPRRLSKNQLDLWLKDLEKIAQKPITALASVVSPTLHKKFVDMEKLEDCDASAKDFGIVKAEECKIQSKLEDDCGICYETLKTKDLLIECGECSNILHKECADFWLRKGTVETCVYCRGTLAYALYLQNEPGDSKKRKRDETTGYKNILK